ncbi:hypothetical protein Tco_0757707 [Tanacetum coccineum]
MVAYLKKPEGSEGFHQIVDFLNASHIRYALIENPTIYVSLIKQFWETATARTLDNGEIELTATIDGKVKIVTEASVRRHLQLADSDGISSLPTTEIFEQLSLMGSPTQSPIADEAAFIGVDVRYGGATTTITSLEAGHDSGNIDMTPTMPHDSPLLRVNTLGSDEGIKSSQARRRARIIVSDDEDDLEDPSKQGRKIAEIDQDPAISLHVEFDFDLDTAKDVSTAKPVSTAGATVTTASEKSAAKDKGKGKMDEYVSTDQDKVADRTRKTWVQKAASSFNVEEWEDIQARVKADEELAQRLQAEEKEMYSEVEQARMLVELINQRKRSHTLQQLRGYSFDEIKTLFETTMRRVNTFVPIESEVDRAVPGLAAGSSKGDVEEELDKEIPEQGINVEALQTKYPIIDLEIYTEGTRKYWKTIGVGNHIEVHQFFDDMLKALDMDDLVELKILFEPNTDDELWKLQKHSHDLTWRLYDSCGVHHVSTEKGIDIYILVEKEYPLSRGTLTLMLVAKLLVEQGNEMSRELLRKIFMQAKRPRK